MVRHRGLSQRDDQHESASLLNTTSKRKNMDRKMFKKGSSRKRSIGLKILFSIAILLILVYLVVPFVFKLSSNFRNALLFMNYVNVQVFMDVTKPESEYGLNCTRVFYIQSNNSIQLGAWHVYPKPMKCDKSEGGEFDDGKSVVFYIHGNGGTRGGSHRVDLYKLLAYGEPDSHVVTFDYRGYGDSSPVSPTIPGVIDDAIHAYRWLLTKVNPKRITMWAHSLGTAVSLSMLRKIRDDELPTRLILEAPFSSVSDAVVNYPLTRIYKYYPFFDSCFVESLKDPIYDLLNSEENIRFAKIPITILHAEDDAIVPVFLGKKLFESSKRNVFRQSQDFKVGVEMKTYEGDLGYGHKHIHRDKGLSKMISNLVYKPPKQAPTSK
ncbi:lysophosphatidylserine lipase ABHD12-like [Brevipalpus obovatus]|uniref:lysophosphatidylserine lipase ABHD12-like n=1 Tax=Brevipalpus obovatus TaxID=246614 RepID=UPI003D9EAA2B